MLDQARQFIASRRWDEAIALLQNPVAHPLEEAERLRLLGVIALHRQQPTHAETFLRQSLRVAHRHETLDNLGVALMHQNRSAEAEPLLRQALLMWPTFPGAENNLGTCLRQLGRRDEAVACYRRALALDPSSASTWLNLASVLRDSNQRQLAIDVARQAVERLSNDYALVEFLAGEYVFVGQVSAAVALLNAWLARYPRHAAAFRQLGMTEFQCLGDVEMGLIHLRQAMEIDPADATAGSNYLCCLHYRPDISPAQLLEEHCLWNARHIPDVPAVPFTRDPQQPLRLGFVSADLTEHPVSRLFVKALEGLKGEACTTIVYCDGGGKDAMTARLRNAAHQWRDVHGAANPALAQLIRSDGVDVLFDLAGQTRSSRLPLFGLRPAPLQATWLGYTGTTGMKAMDLLIADPHQTPAGGDGYYRERVVRLPNCYACPEVDEGAPDVMPLPASVNGYLTFGCFNHPAKIHDGVLAVWAKILQRLPTARLLLKYRWFHDAEVCRRFVARCVRQGIAAERVETLPGWSRTDLLTTYQRVDLALDPFPYSGGITTCEALWMGVPVLTCPGETFASRHSCSYLATLGLHEMIATTFDDYVERAVAWAERLEELQEMRRTLRRRWMNSPLADETKFARDLLALLRGARM